MKRKVLAGFLRSGMVVWLLSVGTCASDKRQGGMQRAPLLLQVGAFAKESGLQRMRERLRKFPLRVDHREGLWRLFVILPEERRGRILYLRRVKSIVPDAFIRRGYRPGENREERSQSEVPGKEGRLDADAILRTRKKFF